MFLIENSMNLNYLENNFAGFTVRNVLLPIKRHSLSKKDDRQVDTNLA